MNNTASIRFNHILYLIHTKGITTKAALMADQQLYANFWLVTQNFVKFCLLSKNGKKKEDGERLVGNNSKVDFLEENGITTRYDITMECLARILKYADNMLKKPTVEEMRSYAYSVVNSVVNTLARTFLSYGINSVSLNDTIKGTSVDREEAKTYEDIIVDNTNNPERLLVERETIKELKEELKAKRSEELTAKKQAILREISKLSTHPREVFVRLSREHLGTKPQDLAAHVIKDGYEKTFAKVIFSIAKKYHIKLEDIHNIFTVNKLTEESYIKDKGLDRLLSRNPIVVSDQISKYASRAKVHLNK